MQNKSHVSLSRRNMMAGLGSAAASFALMQETIGEQNNPAANVADRSSSLRITGMKLYWVGPVVYVKIETNHGITGWGDLKGVDPRPAKVLAESLFELIDDENPTRIEYLWQKLFRAHRDLRGGALMSNENPTLSYTRSGAPIPAEKSPRKLFERLFVQGRPEEIEERVESLKQGRSTLDFVGEQSRRLNRRLSAVDRRRMDQYLTAVRELERRLLSAQEWEYRPKPKIDAKQPAENKDPRQFVERSKMMFDVIKLAIQTDSSRIVSLFIDTTVIHNITHHGNRPEVLAELRGHEERQFDVLNGFLTSLQQTREQGQSLLDSTTVLYGTCMGSANSHSNVNLPVLLAGGGFRHGQHLAFDTENNYPLSNLYVSMLQRMGIETDAFSTGKGTMRGLEMA